jgi:hypothetical protein
MPPSSSFPVRLADACLCVHGATDAATPNLRPPDLPPGMMPPLLAYLYHDTAPEVTSTNAMELLHAAAFFQVPRLRALCEAAIQVRR